VLARGAAWAARSGVPPHHGLARSTTSAFALLELLLELRVWMGGCAELGVGEHLIGRASDCAVRLRDRRISRHHARVVIGSAGVTIEDCHSHNGTLLNDTPLQGRTLLHDLDVLIIGGVRVSVDLAGASVASTLDE